MTEVCRIKKIKKGYAYIELVKTDKCNGCRGCVFGRKNTIVMPAKCDIDVSVGDRVVAEMPTATVGAGAFLIYAIPLLLIIVGACIGLVGSAYLQIGLAAAGLVIGMVLAWIIDRLYRRRDGVLPKITCKAVNSEDGNSDMEGDNNAT